MARRKKIKDPHYQREAKKYPHPIPSREYIMDYLRQRGKPATRQELLKALHIEDDISKSALRRRLRAMERDGQLIFNRRGGYGLIEKMNLIKGRVIGHKEGYGFLVPEQEGEDLYLSAQQMKCVFDGDLVLARTSYVDKKGRLSGEIVEVLERAHDNIVGRYYSQSELGYVVPDNKRINQDIIVPPGKAGKAKSGDFVEVKIISPPTTRTQAIGEVKKHFGDPFTPGVEIDVALHAHAIPYEFPKSVKQAVAPLAKDPSEKDYRGRKDLRDKAFVTIDGEDAKDFDDAVYCEPKPRGGWMLYVAIADVSHYVKPGSALDEEAKLRGNSVYFPGRVIPMLPTALSNHLCSLRPNRDRLVLTCEMAISPTGKLTRYRFYEAVIFSQARLTYTKVAAMLVDNDANLSMRYKKVLPHLKDLKNLYDTLVQQRQDRGAIEFETIETKIEFGADKKIKQIVPRVRNVAHRIIEERMLVANLAAAKQLKKHRLAKLFRVHEGPGLDKLVDLKTFLKEFNLTLKGGDEPEPKHYAELLKQIDGRAEKQLIQMVLLRSLSQAIYTPDNAGHFGLAYDSYTHFTSPIRRYPDLLVHRAIKTMLNGKVKQYPYEKTDMEKLGSHCSMTERRADDATRDIIDWLKCYYMRDHVGSEHAGFIVGVTGFGLFIQLKDIYIEGLLHITALKNDYYHFDAIHHTLSGERSNVTYRIGDVLNVQVARVSLDNREIDLTLA